MFLKIIKSEFCQRDEVKYFDFIGHFVSVIYIPSPDFNASR